MITTIVAAVIAGIIGLVFAGLKLGMGSWFKPKSPAEKALATDDAIAKIAANPPSDAQTMKRLDDGTA